MSKSLNIFIFCVTMCVLGLFVLLYKTESCKPDTSEKLCQETFIPISCTNCPIDCPRGTIIETVTFPTAGIHCKCPSLALSAKPISSSIVVPIPSASAAASQ